MPVFSQRSEPRELVLTPREDLVAGGPAEQLEQQIQTSFKGGVHRIVVDLREVPMIDSAGVRALVRGHTTSERLGRHFCLAGAHSRVIDLLRLSNLDQVFTMSDSVPIARTRRWPWSQIVTVFFVITVGAALVFSGYMWPPGAVIDLTTGEGRDPFGVGTASPAAGPSPLYELAKLIVAAVVGMLVTIVQRHYRADRSPNPTLDQAQVLLCVSGALMMIIIGTSLVRAFGIAGAASIIRFRTPVEDARDITVLFILMGLGMAAGLGGFAVAGLGTVFLCAMFPILNLFASDRPRQMLVEIQAEGRNFPADHVQKVFAVNRIVFEPREVAQGEEATVRYLATLAPNDSLEDLSNQLMGGGKSGIKNVSWSLPKRV